MIIRNRRSAIRSLCEEGDEIFDIESLRFVLQRHWMHLFFVALSAGAIVYLALKMLTPTLFSPQHRVPLYMNPNSLWGFPKTRTVAVDANLSKFDPEETLKKIFDGDFSPERLRAYFEPEGFSLTGCDSGGLSSGFEIRPADGSWSARMKAKLIQRKKKPATLLMWGPVALKMARCSIFLGHWVRHDDWYPDWQTRLWRAGKAKWCGTDPHDRLLVEAKVGTLSGDILHYSNPSISSYVSKINYFSDLYLESRLKKKIPLVAGGSYLSRVLEIFPGLCLPTWISGWVPRFLYRRLDLLLDSRPPHPAFGA